MNYVPVSRHYVFAGLKDVSVKESSIVYAMYIKEKPDISVLKFLCL